MISSNVAAPNKRLRILSVEDQSRDLDLIRATLGAAKIECELTHVRTMPELTQALNENHFDVILSDYMLPSLHGKSALTLAKKICPGTPFIFVSGSINEEIVTDCYRHGATDFVFKQRILRLPQVLLRVVRETQEQIERKKAEEALLQAEQQVRHLQKMDAIGRLAGGMAHDFNNALTAITAYSDFLFSSLDPNDPRREDIMEIKRTVVRTASLTRQLLMFSRQQRPSPRVLNFREVLMDLNRVLRRLLNENIELATHMSEELGFVRIDPGQLQQILMNLIVNARDAIPQGGTITIGASVVVLADTHTQRHQEVKPGRYVMLFVTDTGYGMSPEVLAHLSEPFFTTKGPGKGTGLGLSTVYGVVQQLGGHIEVESEINKGSTFKVYLPQVLEEESQDVSDKTVQLPRGQEMVLVVEDEPKLRVIAERILKEGGYQVVVAENSEEALRLIQAGQKNVELLLTDVIMPGLNGPQLARKIKESKPEIKVLFMSGYADKELSEEGILSSSLNFLPKPFGSKELLDKVCQVLESPSVPI